MTAIVISAAVAIGLGAFGILIKLLIDARVDAAAWKEDYEAVVEVQKQEREVWSRVVREFQKEEELLGRITDGLSRDDLNRLLSGVLPEPPDDAAVPPAPSPSP